MGLSPASRGAVPRAGSDLGLLEDRVDGHDVPLELELGVLESRGDPDQLRQVQDRHLEAAAGRGLELRLPRVERQVVERARRDDRVGPALHRLLDRLDQAAHRGLLPPPEYRDPAAFDLRRVVDRLPAAGLDDRLERPGPVRVLEAEQLRRAQDLAAIERRHAQALQPLVRRLLQQLVALALGDHPEQVSHLDAALVRGDADRAQVVVHPRAHGLVALEDVVRLAQVERADVADRHQRVRAGRLRVGEDPRVQVQVVVGLGLVDVAGSAARHALEIDQLQADLGRKRTGRRVELLRRERREAPAVVRDLPHDDASSSASEASGWCSRSRLASARSPWTMPLAPAIPSWRTRSWSFRASPTFSATCGGTGTGTLPWRSSRSANPVWAIADTTPCVFGTSSVSRSQPVVSADFTNHLACFAPMSWSIPRATDSAPSFAIASRGSTPFGQRSLQK